jgi:hypothetical protein
MWFRKKILVQEIKMPADVLVIHPRFFYDTF